MIMASRESTIASAGTRSFSAIGNARKTILPSPFLATALEIRDMIYKLVLITALPKPRNPTNLSQRQLLNSIDNNGLEPTTWYPIKPLPNPARGLLLTCRQVRDEIINCFLHEQKHGRPSSQHELSITVLDERSLYPTWLLVPLTPSEATDQVWVDIRIAGFRLLGGSRSGWRPSDGWAPALIWGLFNMLNRFLLFGPLFEKDGTRPIPDDVRPVGHAIHMKPQCRPIQELKILVLNVVTPTEVEMEGKPFSKIGVRSHFDTKTVGVMHPETLLLILKQHMRLLTNSPNNPISYSNLANGKILAVRLCLDGKERCSWDCDRMVEVSEQGMIVDE